MTNTTKATPIPINKETTIATISGAIDIARQTIWEMVNSKKLDIKKAERMLVNYDRAIAYCNFFLHNQLTGETAKFIKKIREDKTVLLGHQAQGVYFAMDFEEIHQLNNDILEYEDDMTKDEKADEETKEANKHEH